MGNTMRQLRGIRRFAALFALALAPGMVAVANDTPEQTSLELSYEVQPVVRMGDVVISHADLDAHLTGLPEADRSRAVSSVERIDTLLQSLLLRKALYNAAVEDRLNSDDSVAAVAATRAMQALADEQMRRHVESRLLDDYETQARELYQADPQQFSNDGGYDFTHVLIGTAEREEAEAMRLILDLHERVQEGESLDALASEYSDDEASRDKGGSYENHSLNRLDRNFARALAALENPGDVTGPVRSRFGWHLIRLDGRNEGGTPEWEDVKEQAKALAKKQHAERIRKAYVGQLLDPDQISVVPGSIEALQKRYGYEPDKVRQALNNQS
jgi:peptidyl-prolyl cis-trans isomerase C